MDQIAIINRHARGLLELRRLSPAARAGLTTVATITANILRRNKRR
jgi:hypothetical protein